MLKVCDIMTPNVVALDPESTLREAIDTLVTVRIGGAPVIKRGKIVGVLSATDVLRFESVTPSGWGAEHHEEPLELSEEFGEIEDRPSTFFNHLVSDDGAVSEDLRETEGAQWDFLDDHTVSAAMSRAVCVVSDDLEVSEAAQRMLTHGVQRALVMRSGELAGILTATDILRAVAEHRLTRQLLFG